MINLSVILSAYNNDKIVHKCLESVIAQENADLRMECIIVDDCSTDDTLSVIRRIVGGYTGSIKFRIFRHQSHHGPSRTRNTGLERAEGEYVLFLNDTDLLHPACVDTYMVTLMRYWGSDVVVGNVYNPMLGGNIFNSLSEATFLNGKGDLMCHEVLKNHLYLTACNKLVRRELLTINHIVFDETMAYADILWSFNLFAAATSFVLLPDITYEEGLQEMRTIGQTEKWINTLLSSYTATCELLLDKTPRPESCDNGYYQAHQLFVYSMLCSADNIQKEFSANSQVKRELGNIRTRLFNQVKNDGQKVLYLFFRQDDSLFRGLFKNPLFSGYTQIVKGTTKMLDVLVGR